MIEFMRQLVAGVAEAWQRLTISARVQIAVAGLLTLALISGAVFFGAQPQYARLYDRLDPSESNEIVVWLADNDIPYRIRQGGLAIDVPVRDIPQARIGLAALNVPKSQGVAPGFELFDGVGIVGVDSAVRLVLDVGGSARHAAGLLIVLVCLPQLVILTL